MDKNSNFWICSDDTEYIEIFKAEPKFGRVNDVSIEFPPLDDIPVGITEYGLLIEDDEIPIIDFIKAVNIEDDEIPKKWLICTNTLVAEAVVSSLKNPPLFIGLDFLLGNKDLSETKKLYETLKQTWNSVAIVGITNYEKMGFEQTDTFKEKMRLNGDSVYDKSTIYDVLPNIIRDKIAILDLQKKKEELEKENAELKQRHQQLLKFDYLPEEYGFHGKVKIKVAQTLAEYFCNDDFMDNFIKAKQKAYHHLNIKLYTNIDLTPPSSYVDFDRITTGQIDAYFDHIYGRFMMIAYCIVDKMSISDAYRKLTGVEVSEVQRKFAIKGLRGSRADYNSIIPHLSQEEYKLLIELCTTRYKQQVQKSDGVPSIYAAKLVTIQSNRTKKTLSKSFM